MYGKTLGVANVATGISMLPNTGDNSTLFVIALSLVIVGATVLAATAITSLKKNKVQYFQERAVTSARFDLLCAMHLIGARQAYKPTQRLDMTYETYHYSTIHSSLNGDLWWSTGCANILLSAQTKARSYHYCAYPTHEPADARIQSQQRCPRYSGSVETAEHRH